MFDEGFYLYEGPRGDTMPAFPPSTYKTSKRVYLFPLYEDTPPITANSLLIRAAYSLLPSQTFLLTSTIAFIDSRSLVLTLRTSPIMGRVALPSDRCVRSNRNQIPCVVDPCLLASPPPNLQVQHHKNRFSEDEETYITTHHRSKGSSTVDSRIGYERQHDVDVFEMIRTSKNKAKRNCNPYPGMDKVSLPIKLGDLQETESSSSTDTLSTQISSNSNNTQDQSSLVLTNMISGDAQAPQSTEDTLSDISELTNVESIQRGESLVEINQVVLGNSNRHIDNSASAPSSEEESKAYEFTRHVESAECPTFVVSPCIFA